MKIFTILFFFLTTQAFSQKKDANFYVNAAEKDWSDGKMKRAYENYYKAAELSKNYLYYIKAAEAYCFGHNSSKDKTKETIENLYNKSFQLKEWNTEGLLSRAEYNRFMARYESVFSDLDSLIKRDSTCLDAYLLKASTHLEKRDTTNGFRTYYLATKKAPKDKLAKVYLEQGGDCYIRNLWPKCIDSYLKALELIGETNFKTFHYCNLSSAYSNMGDMTKACKFFKFCDKRPGLKDKDILIKTCGQ
jgi:tetratricopeptide (TPR) repeat protein